jgi:PAS domain S-box-containing protein
MQETVNTGLTVPRIFRELFSSSPLAIYTCDKNGIVTFFNEAAVKLWGITPEIGKSKWCGSWKIFYPDGRLMQLDECPMAIALKQGIISAGEEIMIQLPDLSYKNILVFPCPVFDEAGIVSGAHNTLVDISQQKLEQKKHAILSAIVASSEDAIVSKTLDGIITSWNAGAQKIFGYTEDEIIGKSITILIPPPLYPEENVIITNIKNGIRIDHYQTIRLDKFGKEVPVSLTVSPVKDVFGNITGASKIAHDISDKIAKETALAESAQRLSILNSIGKIISEKLDSQVILQRVTDATTEITGAAFGAFFYNTVDEKGESYMLFTLSGAPREAFEKFGMPRNTAVFDATFSGKGITRVDDITKDPRYGKNAPHQGMPEGHLPVVSYLSVPVISQSGEVMGGLFFGHPEPGVFKAEHESLVASIASQAAVALDNSKLFEEIKVLNAKKDEFIALASHELRTPLTTVKGYLQIIQNINIDPVGKVFITKALKQVDRLNALTSDLFDISKVEAGKLQLFYETFDGRSLILDIIETFRYISPSHTILLEAPGHEYSIVADKQRLEQVIINLVTNAVKYSPHADEVRISLHRTGDLFTVHVKDKGIGLLPEQQKMIFTKFYRANGKSNISGLGLGLYLSQEIISQHKGTIAVESELGVGSVFTFSIPVENNTR